MRALRLRLDRARKIERDGCPDGLLRREAQVAARLFCKSVYLGEAQPAAFPRLFCREERLEGSGSYLWRHAFARIGNGNSHAATQFAIRRMVRNQIDVWRLDGDASTAGHGRAGVDDEIT